MNEQVKQAWLAALRGGEYKQTKGYLEVVEASIDHGVVDVEPIPQPGYCCLGVLCDLAVKAGVVERSVVEGCVESQGYQLRIATYGAVTDDEETLGLPRSVQEWAGLGSSAPLINGDPNRSLPNLNDDLGYTFADIADEIEKWL